MSHSLAWDRLRALTSSEPARLGLIAVAYYVTGKFGLEFASVHPAVSVVWPPAGLALAAFLVVGYKAWPWILGSALALYASVIGPVPAAMTMAGGSTVEGLLASYLIHTYAGGRQTLQHPSHVVKFVSLALISSAVVSATLNALSLVTSGQAPWHDYGLLWTAIALGNFVSVLLLTPLFLLYRRGAARGISKQAVARVVLAIVGVATVGLVAFYDVPVELRGFPIELFCLPLLMIIATMLGRHAASAAMIVLAGVAMYGTLQGHGPYVRSTPFGSLALVEVYLATLAAITLWGAAMSSEYAMAQQQLRDMVATDALTGLPNYRRLLDVLTLEIAEAERQEAHLAVVFFDMDGLKRINDEHGHLAGSRAVCRFAETLRAACRTTDTPARYGGDEFVAVLAGTDQEGAAAVVQRIKDRLAATADELPVSVSAGIAVYPRDGQTPTTLLSAADRALYAAKAERDHLHRRSVVALREWTSVANR